MIKLKKNRIERPLKLGFIGGSLSSTIGQTHYTASHLDGRWNLVSGFFSRNKLININTAKNWNISPNRTYDSLDKFLSKECNKLDAIAVLTPTPNHYETILKVIKKNIPIICEKPLVSSLEQAKSLQKLVKKSKNSLLKLTLKYSRRTFFFSKLLRN